MKQRGEIYEFIQCIDAINALSQSVACNAGPPGKYDDYQGQPWTCLGQMVEDIRRITQEFECDMFEPFKPLRDPRFVLSEISNGSATIELETVLLPHVACEICGGVCRETMTVKECGHRFCNDCIQRWIRKGNTTCPNCPHVKVPSRRVLRPNKIFDEIVNKLLPDLDKFEKLSGVLTSKRSRNQEAMSSSDSESEDDNMDDSVGEGESDDEEDDEEEEDDESVVDTEEEEDDDDFEVESSSRYRSRRNNSTHSANGQKQTLAVPPMVQKSAYGQNLDELYADDMGYLEIFLVCLNNNLPSAVCSMARELSKRPMKLPVGATTRDAAMILAEKLVRDVLGPFDVHSIITDLSFVRDGDIWPAMSQIPLSEVCRQVTESRGPIALRYLLSDRLFSLCERIEASY